MAEKKKAQERPEIEGQPEAVEPPVEPVGKPEVAEPPEPTIPSETAPHKFVIRNILRQAVRDGIILILQ